MNLQKLFTVAAGMVLLAGLAYHQGNNQRQSTGDDSMLVGTAIGVTVQPEEIQETAPETAQSEQPECVEESGLAVQSPDSDDDCAIADGADEVPAEAEENLKG